MKQLSSNNTNHYDNQRPFSSETIRSHNLQITRQNSRQNSAMANSFKKNMSVQRNNNLDKTKIIISKDLKSNQFDM